MRAEQYVDLVKNFNAGMKEHEKSEYEVLVADVSASYEWISSKNGEVSRNAIPGGKTATGETLFIGRVNHEGMQICGKIHPSHKGLYVPYGGKEFHYPMGYEILVSKNM